MTEAPQQMREGQKTGTAQHLRRRTTDAERVLSLSLRNRRLADAKFRRQHPMGPYVVDFVCLEAGLIVELDRGQHAAHAKSDTIRTAQLESLGFHVLRFWNNEVLSNREGVLQVIEEWLKAHHPNPLPHAGEGAKRLCRAPFSLARLREREGPAAKRWEGKGNPPVKIRKES